MRSSSQFAKFRSALRSGIGTPPPSKVRPDSVTCLAEKAAIRNEFAAADPGKAEKTSLVEPRTPTIWAPLVSFSPATR